MKILVNGTIEIDPSQREIALKAAAPLIKMALEENGCLAYNWGADLNDPGLIYVYEEWESKEDLCTHFTMPSYLKMLSHLSGHGLVGANVRKFMIEKEAPIYNDQGIPTSDFL